MKQTAQTMGLVNAEPRADMAESISVYILRHPVLLQRNAMCLRHEFTVTTVIKALPLSPLTTTILWFASVVVEDQLYT